MPDIAKKETGGKELRIVGFLCNWCSYRAADLAGRTVQEGKLYYLFLKSGGAVGEATACCLS